MSVFWLKLMGGGILLASWVFREMWARRQEQQLAVFNRELDGGARAEDAYLVVLTQRRILDSIVYMQSVIGFMDEEMGKPSSQKTNYLNQVNKIRDDLDKSRKSYALSRLSHRWAITQGALTHTDQKDEWNKMPEDEIVKLGDTLAPHIDLEQDRLNRKTRLADRIVAAMYITGALLVLATS